MLSIKKRVQFISAKLRDLLQCKPTAIIMRRIENVQGAAEITPTF